MTPHLLTDPENAKAYQTLCDHPRGSTRAWATKAGWTHSKMVRFLDALKRAGIAEVVTIGRGSLFRNVPERSGTFRPVDLGSKSESDKVPRYGETPRGGKGVPPIADPDDVRLIETANDVLKQRDWSPISLDNFGSLKAAKKILGVVPVDRAIPLLEAAVRQFNPSATDGGPLRSLGHPFITKYVINEYRRTERDLERGQLSMVFVERVEQRPVYGVRKHDVDELPPARPETIAAGVQEFLSLANSHEKPRRM